VQLGQNEETIAKVVPGKRLRAEDGREGESVMIYNHDPKGHWQRLWRIMVTPEELSVITKRSPYKQAPLYAQALRTKMAALDKERAKLLSHKKEGIVFLTHEVEAVCLEHFELEVHSLSSICTSSLSCRDGGLY
jgi:hypothetical protein